METGAPQQLNLKIIVVSILVIIPLLLYSFRSKEIPVKVSTTMVSLCQVRAQFDESDGFDDRLIVSLLALFKDHDFKIGQPVWGPLDTLIYLCEHRLKTGVLETMLERELKTMVQINNGSLSTGRIGWSCA